MRVLVHFSKLPLDKGSRFHVYSDAPGSTTFLANSDQLLAGFMLEVDDLTTKISVDSLIQGVGNIIEMPVIGDFSEQAALNFIEANNIPVFLEEGDGRQELPDGNGSSNDQTFFDVIKNSEVEEMFAIDILNESFGLVRVNDRSPDDYFIYGVGSDYIKNESDSLIDYISDFSFTYEDYTSLGGIRSLTIIDNVKKIETNCYQAANSTQIIIKKESTWQM
jgi:hypothetical protein